MNTYGIYKTLENRIREHVPKAQYRGNVKHILCSIDADEKNDWKNRPYRNDDTLYDYEIFQWTRDRAELQKEKDRLQKQYDSLLNKLGEEDEAKETAKEEEEKSSEEEAPAAEAAVVADLVMEHGRKQKGRPQVACKRTQNKEKQREAMQAKSIKSSLATVQTEIIQINGEIDQLDEKIAAYTFYQKTSIELLKRIRY
jgi:hypothetical protein